MRDEIKLNQSDLQTIIAEAMNEASTFDLFKLIELKTLPADGLHNLTIP